MEAVPESGLAPPTMTGRSAGVVARVTKRRARSSAGSRSRIWRGDGLTLNRLAALDSTASAHFA